MQKEKLSRREQRYRERVNQEVQQVIKQLTDKFMDFFLASDQPEGQEVVEKMQEIAAKWRMYCKNKKLIPEAYPVMEKEMARLVTEYLKEREKTLEDLGLPEGYGLEKKEEVQTSE